MFQQQLFILRKMSIKQYIIPVHQSYVHKIKNKKNGYKYTNMDITANMIWTWSWLKFSDMLLFTMFIVTCIQTSNIELLIQKSTSLHSTFLHRTHNSAQGLDPSESKTSILDICICVTTHTVNNNTSVNFN